MLWNYSTVPQEARTMSEGNVAAEQGLEFSTSS